MDPDPRARFTPANRDELQAAVDAYMAGYNYQETRLPLAMWSAPSEERDAALAPQSRGQDSIHGPIGTWDTSRVTDMSRLFEKHRYFNEDISNWDTSNVTDMRGMFIGALAFNQPINTHTVTRDDGTTYTAWDTSNVTNMQSMFKGTLVFNQDISNWNTSNVTLSLIHI